jgi:hypothetical protein
LSPLGGGQSGAVSAVAAHSVGGSSGVSISLGAWLNMLEDMGKNLAMATAGLLSLTLKRLQLH